MDLLDAKHPKKNCLYLYGPSNALKSTIANSIRYGTPNVGMQITSSDFPFQQCINVNLIYAEEAKITEEIVTEIKRIYEGAEILVNVKCKDGQMLERTPVLCCSNYKPWQFVPTEKATLLNRLFYYELTVHGEFARITKQFSPRMWQLIREESKVIIDVEPIFY